MGGKPPAEIDLAQLEKLAMYGHTIDSAADILGCCKRTLLRYLGDEERPEYRAAWTKGQGAMKNKLRLMQWKHASGTGSSAVQMTIHMSKHLLGETEKSLLELSGPDGGPIDTEMKLVFVEPGDAHGGS